MFAHASMWSVKMPLSHRGIFCELVTSTNSICRPLILELNVVYRVLRSTNVFLKVSRHFYGESEFIVASLSPLRGQFFLS